MKNCLLTILASLAIGTCSYGQGPIISGNSPFFNVLIAQGGAPQYLIGAVEESLYEAVIEDDGPLINWNFQSLALVLTLADLIKFQVECDEAGGSEFFDNCNKVESDIVAQTIIQNRFMQTDGTNWMQSGDARLAFGEIAVTTCSDPRLRFVEDLTMGFNATVEFDCEPQDTSIDFVSATVGSRFLEVDAYGTLSLDVGEYEDVLRLVTVETGVSTTYANGNVLNVNDYELTTIEYLIAAYPIPLITFRKSQEGIFAPTYQVEYLTDGGPLSMQNRLPSVSVLTAYPNPTADGSLTLVSDDFHQTDVLVNLFSLDGRLIYAHSFPAGGEALILDIPEVATGAYLLNAKTPSTSSTIKVMIE